MGAIPASGTNHSRGRQPFTRAPARAFRECGPAGAPAQGQSSAAGWPDAFSGETISWPLRSPIATGRRSWR